MRPLAALVVVASILLALSRAADAQPPAVAVAAPLASSPVADALRTYVRETYPKLILAAEAMPADKYAIQTAPATRPFGETVWTLAVFGRYICGRIGSVPMPWPPQPDLAPTSPKDSLVQRLRDDAQFCESGLARLDDAMLADLISLDLRADPVGQAPRIARGAAIVAATAFWADRYARLAESLRANGIIPPKPSGAGVSDPNPGSGLLRCDPTRPPREGERWGGPGYVFTLSDAAPGTPYTVTSDGHGPYAFGTSNVLVVAASRAGVLVLGRASAGAGPRRAIRVDLSQPVPGGRGTALGIVTDSADLVEVAAQWKAEPDGNRRRAYLLPDIPVGGTVEAAQLDVQFHIDGVMHALQMGPQPIGHCFTDPPAISGERTTRGTISRPDANTWIVNLPPGSVGRLYDVHLGYSHALDRGLYRVALRFVIERQ